MVAGLFEEYRLNGFRIKNRVVMPPLICPGWAGSDGQVSEKHLQHYRSRAVGGVGLIIVEATAVAPEGRLLDSQLGIWSDSQIEGLKKITEACRPYGSTVILQIMHGGLKSDRNLARTPVGPSQLADDPGTRGLSAEEIDCIKEDFIAAAVRARKADSTGLRSMALMGFY